MAFFVNIFEAAATVIDGYEMNRQGRAGEALGISLMSGVVGSLFGLAMLILLTEPLSWLALFSFDSTTTASILRKRLRLCEMPDLYPPDLLREALSLDPADEQAAHALIRHLAGLLSFYTHELPESILVDDTEEWRRELDEFEQLIAEVRTVNKLVP